MRIRGSHRTGPGVWTSFTRPGPCRARLVAGLLGLALLAVLGGCGESNTPVANESPAVPVRLADVESRTLRETVRGIGTLRAKQTVEVRPETSGTIHSRLFREGEQVAAGDVLFELDTRKLRQQLAAAEAALESAEARKDDAERRMRQTERLFRDQVATEDDLEEARNNLRAARSEVRRLESEKALMQERLEDARIKAPLTGIISEALVDPGDFVQAGEHLCTLYQTDVLEVDFSLPERHGGKVRVGQTVSLAVASHPDRTFTGQVIYVSPSISEQSRDFRVKAEVDNPSAHLKPGAFATAVLTIGLREDRPVIPEEALVATREGYFVFVAGPDNKAKRRKVTVGIRNTGVVEITSGLSPGERVIRSGHMRLSHDARFRVMDEGDQG